MLIQNLNYIKFTTRVYKRLKKLVLFFCLALLRVFGMIYEIFYGNFNDRCKDSRRKGLQKKREVSMIRNFIIRI